jgi:hypothetical protein
MRSIYVAHPLGAGTDREQNRANAARWCGWIAKTFRVATVADWIVLSGVWDESPENRALGLEIDKALIERCDELWMVGGRVSEGMAIEAAHARGQTTIVRDFTKWLGYTPPCDWGHDQSVDLVLRQIRREIPWTRDVRA